MTLTALPPSSAPAVATSSSNVLTAPHAAAQPNTVAPFQDTLETAARAASQADADSEEPLPEAFQPWMHTGDASQTFRTELARTDLAGVDAPPVTPPAPVPVPALPGAETAPEAAAWAHNPAFQDSPALRLRVPNPSATTPPIWTVNAPSGTPVTPPQMAQTMSASGATHEAALNLEPDLLASLPTPSDATEITESHLHLPASVPSTNTTLKLSTAEAPTAWRPTLMQALGERVQWQSVRGQEQATISLEPANLGRIDILVRQEGQVLRVAIHATHREVIQQLQGITDLLKQDLSTRHQQEVNVALSDTTREHAHQQRARQEAEQQQRRPGRALAEGLENSDDAGFATHLTHAI